MTASIRIAVTATALLGVLAASPHSQAKSSAPAPAKHTLGADFMVAIPVGDYADITGVGFGFLGRYELRLLPPFALTGRLGFVAHAATKPSSNVKLRTWELPILVGGRYISTLGLWAGLEVGLVVMGAKVTVSGLGFGDQTRKDSEAKFGLVLSGGYRWHDLDFGVALYVPDIDDYLGIGFTVGYNFAGFGR